MPIKRLKLLQIIALIFGVALFVYLIRSIGVGEIFRSVRMVGFGYLVLLALSFFRQVLRSFAWRHCIEENHRNISIFKLFNIRMAGDAVKLLSFTGPLLGETSKAMLIRRELPMVHGMSSLINENISFMLAGNFVIVSGLFLFIANFTMGASVKLMGAVIAAGMIAAILIGKYIISRRKNVLTSALSALSRRTNNHWLKAREAGIAETENKVYEFYHDRGSVFFLVFLLELAAHFVNIFEIYLILYYIGADVTAVIAYITEAVAKVMNVLFFFVPGQIGVGEGGNAFLLQILGLGAAAGVALALVEKIRMLISAAYGFLILTVAFRRRSHKPQDGPLTRLEPRATRSR